MLEINFDKSFYPPSAVKKAVSAYKNIASMKLTENKEQVSVSIKKIFAKELEALFKLEFSNYVLFLTGTMK